MGSEKIDESDSGTSAGATNIPLNVDALPVGLETATKKKNTANRDR